MVTMNLYLVNLKEGIPPIKRQNWVPLKKGNQGKSQYQEVLIGKNGENNHQYSLRIKEPPREENS